MNYLFFDLEFASCRGGYYKICEFGYALTDETFQPIERGTLLINPSILRSEWDFYALRKIIKRKISDFTSEPTFVERYPFIRALFEKADLAFGHSVSGDVKALLQECERYSLPPLRFDFFDLAGFYKKFTACPNQRALTAILSDLNISGDEKIHDAGSDAFNTMLGIREVLKRENEELFLHSPSEALKNFAAKHSFTPRKSDSVSTLPHRKINHAPDPTHKNEKA